MKNVWRLRNGFIFANLVFNKSVKRSIYLIVLTLSFVLPFSLFAGSSSIIEETVATGEVLAKETPIPVDANDDYMSVVSGTSGTINVLTNDVGDSDPGSIVITIDPQNGSVQVGTNGNLTYTPWGSFSGTDQFSYEVCENGNPSACDAALVTVDVLPNFTDPCSEAVATKRYYMPFPENSTQLGEALFQASDNYATYTGVMRNVTSIETPYPSTIIYYDHWEDGYEDNIKKPLQSTTKIWGDGDLTNGIAPGYPDDYIPAGGYIVLDNNFVYDPRDPSEIVFDGSDKLVTTFDVAISKVTGDNGVFEVQAAKSNVFDTSRYGQLFTLGLGEVVGIPYFSYASIFITASIDNTTVEIDLDNDGTADYSNTLNEGEVWFYQGDPAATAIATAKATIIEFVA